MFKNLQKIKPRSTMYKFEFENNEWIVIEVQEDSGSTRAYAWHTESGFISSRMCLEHLLNRGYLYKKRNNYNRVEYYEYFVTDLFVSLLVQGAIHA